MNTEEWYSNKTKKKLDIEAEVWLSGNDPLYKDWRKRKATDYPYLTEAQMRRRSEREIPLDPTVIDSMK